MPNTRDRRSRTSGSASILAEHDLDAADRRPHFLDVQAGERAVNVADEPADEPRAVLALERDLRVVDEDGNHDTPRPSLGELASGGRGGGRGSGLMPDMTADSIVAGRPVSIQSPASRNPSIAVRVPGPRRRIGRQRERRALFANRQALAQRRRSRGRQRFAHFAAAPSPPARRWSARRSFRRRSRSATGATRRRRRCARRSKTHWKLRPGRPTSGSCMTAAIEPQVDGHDRQARQRGRVGDGLARAPAGI